MSSLIRQIKKFKYYNAVAGGHTNIEIGQYNILLNAWVLDDTVFGFHGFLLPSLENVLHQPLMLH